MQKLFFLPFVFLVLACSPARQGAAVRQPNPQRPVDRPGRHEPIDTIRWANPNNPKPPITNQSGRPDQPRPDVRPGDTYHLALLLPFLSNKFENNAVPDKSKLAMQFYAGARIALDQLSKEEGLNLVVDVFDTQAEDADFQKLMSDRQLAKSSVFIGPIRPSHVSLMAEWTKQNRKILISPESPNTELTHQNPDFIQINPSLRSHCETIAAYVANKGKDDPITVVCKQKEADRLPYFKQYLRDIGSANSYNELTVADDIKDFNAVAFQAYFKPGHTAIFILPTWSSQDFVMAFLRRLKAVKGSNRVEVYGMPQWKNFESIEAEYLTDLNVHISSATWIDYTAPEVKTFQKNFYEATGTIPDESGFNGYDVMLFTGKMLKKYGLSFPDFLSRETFNSFQGPFRILPHIPTGGTIDINPRNFDYQENKKVHILKFGKSGFEPVDK
jgi:ABC-type branched-subunit amino acid transport system substrate-binding protein